MFHDAVAFYVFTRDGFSRLPMKLLTTSQKETPSHLLHQVALLTHAKTKLNLFDWCDTRQLFSGPATFISSAWTRCTVLIQSRNMNRCDMGNLFTWPRAVVGQNWAAPLSLELKSSSQRLTEVSVGDPKEITHVLRTMAPKPNSLSRSLAPSLCLKEMLKGNFIISH